jgi:hypothetical protein
MTSEMLCLSGQELAASCEAFLAGRYVEDLDRRGRRVPVWAWTNLLAHGSRGALRRALRSARRESAGSVWGTARAEACRELLRVTEDGPSLRRLQHDVLVPLELSLAAEANITWWTPENWTAAVLGAVERSGAI